MKCNHSTYWLSNEYYLHIESNILKAKGTTVEGKNGPNSPPFTVSTLL